MPPAVNKPVPGTTKATAKPPFLREPRCQHGMKLQQPTGMRSHGTWVHGPWFGLQVIHAEIFLEAQAQINKHTFLEFY